MLGVVSSCPTRASLRVRYFHKCSNEHFTNVILVSQLHPFVDHIFQLLHTISQDFNRSEGLMRATMGVIGYASFTLTILTS